MPTSRCPTLICSGRGSKVIAFQSRPHIIIQAIHFLSVVCDHILNTELMHESQRGDKCVRFEILIFMINSICSFFLLSSFRTCQGGSGPGTDAGAEHSDGVSEQNEGTSKRRSTVQTLKRTPSDFKHKNLLPNISLKPKACVNCSVCTC